MTLHSETLTVLASISRGLYPAVGGRGRGGTAGDEGHAHAHPRPARGDLGGPRRHRCHGSPGRPPATTTTRSSTMTNGRALGGFLGGVRPEKPCVAGATSRLAPLVVGRHGSGTGPSSPKMAERPLKR